MTKKRTRKVCFADAFRLEQTKEEEEVEDEEKRRERKKNKVDDDDDNDKDMQENQGLKEDDEEEEEEHKRLSVTTPEAASACPVAARGRMDDEDEDTENEELHDEVSYAVDGLGTGTSTKLKLASLGQLATLCASVPRRRRLRAARLRPAILNAVVNLSDHKATTQLAQACAAVLMGVSLSTTTASVKMHTTLEPRALQVGDSLRFLTSLLDVTDAPVQSAQAYRVLRGVLGVGESPSPQCMALRCLETVVTGGAHGGKTPTGVCERLLQLGAIEKLAAIALTQEDEMDVRGEEDTVAAAARILQNCTAGGGASRDHLARQPEFVASLVRRICSSTGPQHNLPHLHLLVNLTNANADGCAAARDAGCLDAFAGRLIDTVATASTSGRDEDAHKEDMSSSSERVDAASGVLCLLTNLVEDDDRGAQALAARVLHGSGGAVGAHLLHVLCAAIAGATAPVPRTLAATVTRCGAASETTGSRGNDGKEKSDDEEEMSHEELHGLGENRGGDGDDDDGDVVDVSIVGSYAALLCCMLIGADARVADGVVASPAALMLSDVVDAAASFVAFHVAARTLSAEDAVRANDAIESVRRIDTRRKNEEEANAIDKLIDCAADKDNEYEFDNDNESEEL